MPRFMLDTDTCSFILKRSNEVVPRRLQAVPINDVCISVITKAELLLGVELSPRRHQDSTAVDAFLLHVAVFSLPDEAALHYATFSSSQVQTVSYPYTQGFSTVTDIGSKSARFRVTTIRLWTRAVAAINESL